MNACCDHTLLGNGNFYQHVVHFILNSNFLSLSSTAMLLLKSCEFVPGLTGDQHWGSTCHAHCILLFLLNIIFLFIILIFIIITYIFIQCILTMFSSTSSFSQTLLLTFPPHLFCLSSLYLALKKTSQKHKK